MPKLFDEIGARFADRQGGYTRIVKTGYRAGDSAPMAVIELTVRPCTPRRRKEAGHGQERDQGHGGAESEKKRPQGPKEPSPRAEKAKAAKAKRRDQAEEERRRQAGGQEKKAGKEK